METKYTKRPSTAENKDGASSVSGTSVAATTLGPSAADLKVPSLSVSLTGVPAAKLDTLLNKQLPRRDFLRGSLFTLAALWIGPAFYRLLIKDTPVALARLGLAATEAAAAPAAIAAPIAATAIPPGMLLRGIAVPSLSGLGMKLYKDKLHTGGEGS